MTTEEIIKKEASKIVSDLADAYFGVSSQASEHYTYAYDKDFVRQAIYHVNAQIETLDKIREWTSKIIEMDLRLEYIKSELESRINK